MTDRDDRRGYKIASMKTRMPVNFEEHSGTLVGYIPTDDDLKTIDDEIETLRLISGADADVRMPDRTPLGAFELLHSWAMQWFHNRSKQKS